jgi:hypothetical protein
LQHLEIKKQNHENENIIKQRTEIAHMKAILKRLDKQNKRKENLQVKLKMEYLQNKLFDLFKLNVPFAIPYNP